MPPVFLIIGIVFLYIHSENRQKVTREMGCCAAGNFRDLCKQPYDICFCFPVLLHYSKTCKIYSVRIMKFVTATHYEEFKFELNHTMQSCGSGEPFIAYFGQRYFLAFVPIIIVLSQYIHGYN